MSIEVFSGFYLTADDERQRIGARRGHEPRGGFLGMFLRAMLGFAVCMKFVVDRAVRNDGTVHANQALLPVLGGMAAACIGAVAGALLIRLEFAADAKVVSRSGERTSGER
jgi:hypothetical protein